jgi:hypothetical protein
MYLFEQLLVVAQHFIAADLLNALPDEVGNINILRSQILARRLTQLIALLHNLNHRLLANPLLIFG